MKFKLLGGTHTQFGKTYRKGEIIDCVVDLALVFAGKFQVLHPETAPNPTAHEKEGDEVKDNRGIEMTGDFASAASEGYRVFRRGSWYHIFEGDSYAPLNSKGLRVSEVDQFMEYLEKSQNEQSSGEDLPQDKKGKDEAPEPKETSFGTDVTLEFPHSAARGYLVYRRGSRFYVYEKGEDTPLNDSGLKKVKVDDFTKSDLEEK